MNTQLRNYSVFKMAFASFEKKDIIYSVFYCTLYELQFVVHVNYITPSSLHVAHQDQNPPR